MSIRYEYFLLFVGMMAVTYIPRVLSFYLYEKLVIPSFIENTLKILPCVAIGVFIFPEGINLYPESSFIAPVALLTSAVVTWFSDNIPLGVFSAISVTFLLGL